MLMAEALPYCPHQPSWYPLLCQMNASCTLRYEATGAEHGALTAAQGAHNGSGHSDAAQQEGNGVGVRLENGLGCLHMCAQPSPQVPCMHMGPSPRSLMQQQPWQPLALQVFLAQDSSTAVATGMCMQGACMRS